MARELLFSITKKDFRIDTFRAGGKGGQKQNKTSSGVRITHIESGAVGESREHRSQAQNKKTAFERCINSEVFKRWHKRKVAEILRDKSEIDRQVSEAMREENIKTEVFDGKKWTEVGDADGQRNE
jgi:protein subunit release factor A